MSKDWCTASPCRTWNTFVTINKAKKVTSESSNGGTIKEKFRLMRKFKISPAPRITSLKTMPKTKKDYSET
jgi:hypothetical protein